MSRTKRVTLVALAYALAMLYLVTLTVAGTVKPFTYVKF
jgi:hypothetical protein